MHERLSGILLPVASLPAPDIGNFGPTSFDFIDSCKRAGQRLWQVLPLGPTITNDSPFYSPSAFAISPNYIDLSNVVQRGLLQTEDLEEYYQHFAGTTPNKIHYDLLWTYKMPLLAKAHQNFIAGNANRDAYDNFVNKHRHWLEEYGDFMGIKTMYANSSQETWFEWDEPFKDYATFQQNKHAPIHQQILHYADLHRFLQWLAFSQWQKLKTYANDNRIRIIGDCPIYVAPDSADVWANRPVFKLDDQGRQTCFAGVPPDYFSPKYGQFWGNPIYRWYQKEQFNEHAFAWWTMRLQHQFSLFDELRIDHFRGFAAYWEIPRDKCEIELDGQIIKTAKCGKWKSGPALKLFEYIASKLNTNVENLPIIAEDLGVITEDVNALRIALRAPGMGILQFAPWGEAYVKQETYVPVTMEHLQNQTINWQNLYYCADSATGTYRPFLEHEFLPHNAIATGKGVFYPGTHDNETLWGWFTNKDRSACEQRLFKLYINNSLKKVYGDDSPYLDLDLHWQVLALLSASDAVSYVICQMQDILGLPNEDPEHNWPIRTNIPNRKGQWQWKMGKDHVFTLQVQKQLAKITEVNERAL